jgi:hypothetical protein
VRSRARRRRPGTSAGQLRTAVARGGGCSLGRRRGGQRRCAVDERDVPIQAGDSICGEESGFERGGAQSGDVGGA